MQMLQCRSGKEEGFWSFFFNIMDIMLSFILYNNYIVQMKCQVLQVEVFQMH